MKKKTQHILTFYLLILAPMIGLIVLLFYNLTYAFVVGMLVYALVYRPLTDGYRLHNLGKISKSEIYKIFIPFHHIRLKHFKSLYLPHNKKDR